jgi:Winged helix DNA-binding domain
VTNRAIAQARLRSSRLVPDAGLPRAATPADVVRWFGAVQSQDVPGALWAIAQRLPPGATADNLSGAFDRGEIVRTHAMRPTWHFLAPDDLRWIQALTRERVHRLNGTLQRRLGITAEDFDRATAVVRGALAGGRALTRDELRATLAGAGFDVSDNLTTSLLGMHAELDAVICNGPRRGKQIPFVLVDDWIPPTPPRSRDDSLRDLAVRYFASHGPALVKDMAWWSGLTMSDVRRGIELAGASLERRTIDDAEYVAAPDGFEPATLPVPHVRLLSNYDEYLGSYADASPIFDRSLPKPRTVADVLGAHIVVRDGLVVGGWRRAIGPKRIAVRVTLLADLTSDECDALAAQAEALGRFFGLPAELVLSRA